MLANGSASIEDICMVIRCLWVLLSAPESFAEKKVFISSANNFNVVKVMLSVLRNFAFESNGANHSFIHATYLCGKSQD